MSKLLLTSIVLLIGLTATAQTDSKIDSLVQAYENHKEDTLKVRTANEIIEYYMYREIDKVESYARQMVALSKQLQYGRGESAGLYKLGVYHYNLSANDSAKYYYKQSLAIALENELVERISSAYRGLSIIEFSQGNLIASDSINDLDLANSIKYQDSMGMALAYDFKGTINENKGYNDIALKNVQKGLKIFEALGDSIRIADTYTHLAKLEYNIKNVKKYVEYNKIALAVYEREGDVFYQANALNDIGIGYMLLEQFDLALEYLDETIELCKKTGAQDVTLSALTNKGEVNRLLGNYQIALDYFQQALELSEALNSRRKGALVENKMAQTYLSLNQPTKALELANRSLEYSIPAEGISYQRVSQRSKSEAYEQLGNYSKALEHYKEYKAINDSIYNKETSENIENLRAQFDLEKKEARLALQEQEIIVLDAQAKSDRLAKLLYGLGFAAAVIIGLLIFFGLRQRIKKNKIEREKQEAILRQEIEFKKKELATQTLHLVQKSTFIQELKENLEKLKASPELFKIEFRRLILLLKRESAEDKDWEVFKSYFSEVHNNFDEKIKKLSDQITEKEMRLASFLRMKLTTKEIASMLNVLPESVLKSKYRLKQKLALDKDTDLTEFLNTL